jgi:DNA-binding transcriptional LysR family regulator
VDLIEEGFDVALRGGRMHDSTLVARKLVDTKLLVCAAPNYLERRGTPHTPEDLRHHDGIVLGSLWTGTGLRARGPRGLVELPVRASVVSNDLAVVCGLLVRGTGIGLMENGLAATHLRAGRLVQVLPDYGMHHDGGFYIVYPSRVHVPARVRAFVDFMIAHCRENNPLVEHGSPA